MTGSVVRLTRWCASCRWHVTPDVAHATTEHEGKAVLMVHESCPTCGTVVAETVTGPGAHAWALAQGVEVRT